MHYDSYATFLKEPRRSEIFLLLLSVGEPKYLWMPSPFTFAVHSGAAYVCDYPVVDGDSYHIWRVTQGGVPLLGLDDKDDVAGTEGSWFFNINDEKKLYIRANDDVNLATTNAYIQVWPLIPIVTDIPEGLEFVQFDIPFAFNNSMAPKTQFLRAILESGLGNISYSLVSAYHGVVLPTFSSMDVANQRPNIITLNGRFDNFFDRFQIVDGTVRILRGDGGERLAFEDHYDYGEFRLVDGYIQPTRIHLDFATTFSQLDKLVPTNIYNTDAIAEDFEEELRGKYKPWCWGSNIRVPSYQISENEWSFLDPLYTQDDVIGVWKVGKNVQEELDPADYEVGEGIIALDTPIEDPYDTIEVVMTKCWDMDGAPTALQYAGAWARQALIQLGEIPEAQVPDTSFVDYDTNFPTEVIVYFRGDKEPEPLKNKFQTLLTSTISSLKFKNNIYTFSKYDIDNIVAAVGAIKNDQLISPIKKYLDPKELNSEVVFSYAYRPNDDIYKQVKKKLNTAVMQYKASSAPLVIEPSYLKNKADAESNCVTMLCLVAREKCLLDIQAEGEISDALPSEMVDLSANRAPTISGIYQSESFIIRNSSLNTGAKPEGITNLTLEEPITPEIRDAILAEIDFPPSEETSDLSESGEGKSASDQDTNVLTISAFTHAGDGLTVKIFYNMTGADPDISPTSVKWNTTEDLTEGVTTDTSVNVRSSIWYIIGGTAGTFDIDIVMPANVHCIAAQVQSWNNITGVGNSYTVYQATGRTLEKTGIVCAVGDLVIDAYTCERAPPPAQHSAGEQQTVDFSLRLPYSDNYSSEDALRAIGSRKDGAASVTMRHVEELNNQRKACAFLVLEA